MTTYAQTSPPPATRYTETPTPQRVSRTALQKTRDVLLSLMAVLVSLVCALVLYLAFTAGSALAELGHNGDPAVTQNFEPTPTGPVGEECQAEVPPPGC